MIVELVEIPDDDSEPDKFFNIISLIIQISFLTNIRRKWIGGVRNLKIKNQDNELIPTMTDYILTLQFIKHKTKK